MSLIVAVTAAASAPQPHRRYGFKLYFYKALKICLFEDSQGLLI